MRGVHNLFSFAALASSTVTAARAEPNPSLEARPNIKMPGPRSGLAHFPPRGPGILLLVPPQLERLASEKSLSSSPTDGTFDL